MLKDPFSRQVQKIIAFAAGRLLLVSVSLLQRQTTTQQQYKQ
jgi:hypothetical protein